MHSPCYRTLTNSIMLYLYIFTFVSPSAQQDSYISADLLQNQLSDLHVTSYTDEVLQVCINHLHPLM